MVVAVWICNWGVGLWWFLFLDFVVGFDILRGSWDYWCFVVRSRW